MIYYSLNLLCMIHMSKRVTWLGVRPNPLSNPNLITKSPIIHCKTLNPHPSYITVSSIYIWSIMNLKMDAKKNKFLFLFEILNKKVIDTRLSPYHVWACIHILFRLFFNFYIMHKLHPLIMFCYAHIRCTFTPLHILHMTSRI